MKPDAEKHLFPQYVVFHYLVMQYVYQLALHTLTQKIWEPSRVDGATTHNDFLREAGQMRPYNLAILNNQVP